MTEWRMDAVGGVFELPLACILPHLSITRELCRGTSDANPTLL